MAAVPVDPETEAKKKTVANRKPVPVDRKSRGQRLREAGKEPDLPDVEVGGHLVGYLMEAGPVVHTAMGSAPLSWADINVWQEATGTELQPWEARLIRRLSHEYLSQLQTSEAPDCVPPWVPEMTEESRENVSGKVQTAFRMLMQTRPKK